MAAWVVLDSQFLTFINFISCHKIVEIEEKSEETLHD